jgi:hypothetical protein
MATYSITFVSGSDDGDVVGASELFLTMFGTKASTREFRPASSGRVEPGRHATYRVALTDLGDIQRVRVRHDHTGVGPGCYLDRIVVRAVGTLQRWEFICQRWFARHDDGATERVLDALARRITGALAVPAPR